MHKTPKKLSVKYVVENEGSQKLWWTLFFPWSTRNNNDRGMRNGCIQLHGLIFIQLLLPFSMLLSDVFFIPFWAVWVMLCLILLVMVTGSLKNGPGAKCIKMCVHCVMHVRIPMGIFFTWVLFLSMHFIMRHRLVILLCSFNMCKGSESTNLYHCLFSQ